MVVKALTISTGGEQQESLVPNITSVMLLDGTQAMTAGINLGGFTGINSTTPVNPNDLATKNYVDTHSSSSGFDSFLLMGS